MGRGRAGRRCEDTSYVQGKAAVWAVGRYRQRRRAAGHKTEDPPGQGDRPSGSSRSWDLGPGGCEQTPQAGKVGGSLLQQPRWQLAGNWLS